jgi:protocatechuate 3,4-dioxygenase beta subunit
MFFPGEPLNEADAVLNAIRDPEARRRCVARLMPTAQGPENALVYEYQLVVRGRKSTPGLP